MKKIILILIVFFAVGNMVKGQGTWVQKANFPGVARMYEFAFSIINKGYVGGGYDILHNFLNDFWEYDPSTNTWNQMANFPGSPTYAPTSFSIGNKGYVGMGGDVTEFWEYDQSLNI